MWESKYSNYIYLAVRVQCLLPVGQYFSHIDFCKSLNVYRDIYELSYKKNAEQIVYN